MSTVLTPRRFTREEYERMIQLGILLEEEKVELFEGQIVASSLDLLAMSPQSPLHQALTASIATRLHGLFAESKFCIQTHSPLGVGTESVPEPDVFVARSRCQDFERRRAEATDAVLVVEVSISSLVFDRGVKSKVYAQGGVPEYWVVDIESATLEVRREPSQNGYSVIRLLRGSDPILPLALEGTGASPLAAADCLPASTAR